LKYEALLLEVGIPADHWDKFGDTALLELTKQATQLIWAREQTEKRALAQFKKP